MINYEPEVESLDLLLRLLHQIALNSHNPKAKKDKKKFDKNHFS